ncbi:MAG: hypothetical protein AB7S44_02095 [Spirochaetales bacterium]
MKKYLELLKYELKNTWRDKMNAFMVIFPFFVLLLTVLLYPALMNRVGADISGMSIATIVIIIVMLGFGYVGAAALLGFSLLDNKDEDTLQTIAVTPIGKRGYVKFKVIYTYIFAVISTIIVLWGTKILAGDSYVVQIGAETIKLFDNINFLEVLVFAISSSLFVPSVGLFIVGLSKNKIEGFAYMKSTGFLMLIPMLILLDTFKGLGQYLLSLFPNFWSVQGIISEMLPQMFASSYNLNFYLYMLIGGVICLAYSVLAYKIYMRKENN